MSVWPFWLKPPAGLNPSPLLCIPASGVFAFRPAMALVSELLREASRAPLRAHPVSTGGLTQLRLARFVSQFDPLSSGGRSSISVAGTCPS